MTKAPERIWIQDPDGCGAVSFCDKQVNADDQQYIRADLHNELMRAADSLADAVEQERNMACQDFGMQLKASEVVDAALTAYQQSKEKLG